jgi:16S rRNA (uracil1498-N3)-methyltransferase
MPRFYCPLPLATGHALTLPIGAARHVQVLRLQPGDTITLFNGEAGGEFEATVSRMGRSDVEVTVGLHNPVEREAARSVHLAVGMPANERMDWLVEKATELGVASIQPLVTERTVLRLSAERAEKKQAHWQSIAVAACEQCGRNRVPPIHAVKTFAQWAKAGPQPHDVTRYLLSLRTGSQRLRQFAALAPLASLTTTSVTFLSGPEGGLSDSEELAALASGFVAVSLGDRVLRAETAALAALTLLA